MPHAPTPLHAAWDNFIDTLDRAGQCGSAADVEIPATLSVSGVAVGTRFGDLSSTQVAHLTRFALTLERRGDVIRDLWRDMRDRARWKAVAARRKARTDPGRKRPR